jgi:uncharacterized membrane protein
MGFTAVRANQRRGAASVECAVCLPVILLIVFGTIEACAMIFLQQNAQLIAYEAVRVAASPYHDVQQAASAGQEIMDQLGLQGGTVTIETTPLPGYSNIRLVSAVVTLPTAPNRPLPEWVLPIPQLSARCTMVKEKDRYDIP